MQNQRHLTFSSYFRRHTEISSPQVAVSQLSLWRCHRDLEGLFWLKTQHSQYFNAKNTDANSGQEDSLDSFQHASTELPTDSLKASSDSDGNMKKVWV